MKSGWPSTRRPEAQALDVARGAARRRDRRLALAVAVAGCIAHLSGARAEDPPAAGSLALDAKADCGAKGDGRSDDSVAVSKCLAKLGAASSAPGARALHFPAGTYLLSGQAGAFPTIVGGAAITGDGPLATVIVLDKTFAGDLFAWSESWQGASYGADALDVGRDASGPLVSGLRVVGSRHSLSPQTALAFYDRNDFVLLRDVEIAYVNGPCLAIGRTRRTSQAYMRESTFSNVKCWNSGTTDQPAVEIGSATSEGSDATNEVDVYKLAVFAAEGTGLAIRNAKPFSATRGLRFFGLRVEQSGADGVDIAPRGDQGQVAGVSFYDLTIATSGGAGLRIGAPNGPAPYLISVFGGTVAPSNRIGVEIDNGRLIDITMGLVGAPIVLGPQAGTDIAFHGNGSEYAWDVEGSKASGSVAQPLNLSAPFSLYGLPQAGAKVGAAALQGSTADGSPVRLTMDGKAPDAYNCFNPSFRQNYNIGIRLIAQDRTSSGRWLAWSLPLATLSAWSGPATAKMTSAQGLTLAGSGLEGASAAASADPQNGCLSLVFNPPPGDHDPWDVSALIEFARAP